MAGPIRNVGRWDPTVTRPSGNYPSWLEITRSSARSTPKRTTILSGDTRMHTSEALHAPLAAAVIVDCIPDTELDELDSPRSTLDSPPPFHACASSFSFFAASITFCAWCAGTSS